jgi:hypothetical protein
MSDNPEEKWIELYTTAMLELKHALMAGRILEARAEIAARIENCEGFPVCTRKNCKLSPMRSKTSERSTD